MIRLLMHHSFVTEVIFFVVFDKNFVYTIHTVAILYVNGICMINGQWLIVMTGDDTHFYEIFKMTIAERERKLGSYTKVWNVRKISSYV